MELKEKLQGCMRAEIERFVQKNGIVYEWVFQQGTVKKYNKRGWHLGEFDHLTGVELRSADSTRKVEP